MLLMGEFNFGENVMTNLEFSLHVGADKSHKFKMLSIYSKPIFFFLLHIAFQ